MVARDELSFLNFRVSTRLLKHCVCYALSWAAENAGSRNVGSLGLAIIQSNSEDVFPRLVQPCSSLEVLRTDRSVAVSDMLDGA
jgi:hypothetical protein